MNFKMSKVVFLERDFKRSVKKVTMVKEETNDVLGRNIVIEI